MTNENPASHMPTHQYSSTTQKKAKEDWDTLVKMTEMQTEFRKAFSEWSTDKGNSGHIVELGEELMELQKSTGKAGGALSYYQMMHRVEEAKAAIAKGEDIPVAKKNADDHRLIRKHANGSTTWVIK